MGIVTSYNIVAGELQFSTFASHTGAFGLGDFAVTDAPCWNQNFMVRAINRSEGAIDNIFTFLVVPRFEVIGSDDRNQSVCREHDRGRRRGTDRGKRKTDENGQKEAIKVARANEGHEPAPCRKESKRMTACSQTSGDTPILQQLSRRGEYPKGWFFTYPFG